jgi:superfamily II DNA/RNA helicase
LFACSATLAAGTLEQLEKLAGFKRNRKVLRTSIDRPEISYVLQQIPEKTKKTYTSLYFLLDEAIDETGKASPGRIPKTLVFLDSREQIIAAVAIFRQWLQAKDPEGYSTDICNRSIVAYFRDVSERDKRRIYNDFSKVDSPPKVVSKTRILFCTKIIAQGANCPDVERVVQYCLLESVQSLDLLYQRFGRAARRRGAKGKAFLFAEKWFFGSREAPAQRKAMKGKRPLVAASSQSFRTEEALSDDNYCGESEDEGDESDKEATKSTVPIEFASGLVEADDPVQQEGSYASEKEAKGNKD